MEGSMGRADFCQQLQGEVVFRGEPGYEARRQSLTWNGRKTDRLPDMLVIARNVDDVVLTVNFARSNNKVISCKTGGHSHSVCYMHPGCVLLDMSQLKALRIIPERKLVYVEPGVTSQELDSALIEHSLFFPVGHEGTVTMAGFLLGGGLGINNTACGGMSTFSIVAVDVILSTGERCHATESDNPDIYWAARGGVANLFFAVIGFHLQCFKRPKCVVVNSYTFGLGCVPDITRAIDSLVENLSTCVEVILSLPHFSEELMPQEAGSGRHCAVITAMAFSESEEHAFLLHEPLAQHAIMANALQISRGAVLKVEQLFEIGDKKISSRWRVDNILTNDLAFVAEVLAANLPASPAKSVLPLMIWMGTSDYPDAAYSTRGRYFVSTYVEWEDAEQDLENEKWLYDTYSLLQSCASGFYVNELDREARPENIDKGYTRSNWNRLCALKKEHDPLGVFLGTES